ncbi:hypothetical protein ACFLYO_07160 [Chloroflexota bacterium]
MTEQSNDQRPEVPADTPAEIPERVSLRGKGWQIMRGAVPPEEYQPASELPDVAQPLEESTVVNWMAAPELSKIQSTPEAAAGDYLLAEVSGAILEEASSEFEAIPQIEAELTSPIEIAPDYEPRSAVQSLVPVQPEELADADIMDEQEGGGTSLRVVAQGVPDLAASGVVIRPQDTRLDAGKLTPPGTAKRPAAGTVFPDDELLDKFVTDERLERVWHEIEALQSELAERVDGDPALVDVYQQELLQASALLLQDRANYDDVRAILYGVQVDLARGEQNRANIKKYKPQILIYLVLIFILWFFLMALEPVVNQVVTEVLGFATLGVLYHATLFGMLGALVFATFTLNKHTVQERDFDPAHMSWYLMNPLIGLIMGLLMALVFGTSIVSTIGFTAMQQPGVTLNQYPFLLWILCFLAGYNQNVILQGLHRVFALLRGKNDDEPVVTES